jgi:hypothetical protein
MTSGSDRNKFPGKTNIGAHIEGFRRAPRPLSGWLDTHVGLSPAAPG